VCWFGSDRGHKTFLVYSLEYKGTTGVAVVRCITPLTVVGLCVYPVDYTKRRNHRIVTQSLKDRSGVAKDIIPKPFRSHSGHRNGHSDVHSDAWTALLTGTTPERRIESCRGWVCFVPRAFWRSCSAQLPEGASGWSTRAPATTSVAVARCITPLTQ
jgi:hypothetical protein